MLNSLKSFFDAVFAGDQQAIVLLTSIYFASAGVYWFVYCFRIKSWPATRGTLLNFDLENMGPAMRSDEQNYEASVKYTYNVAGKDYEGSRLSPTLIFVSSNLRFILNWQMRKINKLGAEQVAVLYNPSKPEKSFLIRPGIATFILPTILLLIAIMLALY